MSSGAEAPFPSTLRFLALLLYRPLTLYRLLRGWGIDPNASLLRLRGRWREPAVAGLLRSWGIAQLVVVPCVIAAVCGVGMALGWQIGWADVLAKAAGGVAGGVALGVAGGVALGVAVGVAGGLAGSVAGGLAVSVAGGVAFGVAFGVDFGVFFGVGAGVGIGVGGGVALGLGVGVGGGVAVGVAFGLGYWRAPLFLKELPLALWVAWRNHRGSAGPPRAVALLPTRFDEIIYFPLPFLRSTLVHIAERDAALGATLLSEAAANIGQRRAAAGALADLQAGALQRLAMERAWARRAEVPFVDADAQAPFFAAAADLEAAALATQGGQQRRRRLLEGARRTLQGALQATITHPGRHGRVFLPVYRDWLAQVDALEAELAQEVPEVPDVFRVGSPLRGGDPDERALFKGRADLVAIINQDLSARHRAPLLLTGQRRMGKSSLLAMLPRLLGSVETVVTLDFQQLSGDPRRGRPHDIVVATIAQRLDRPPPPDAPTWGPALAWLRALDADLADRKHRVLVAIDEVEGLEKGIEEGWASADFLDFLRAAGDGLAHIRLLVISAHPMARLGPHWADRLISAVPRRLGPLLPDQAEELLCAPIPDFPPIWPPGAVARIRAAVADHPFLLQVVGNDVVRALNSRGALVADDDDVDRALDRAVTDGTPFQDLWATRTPEERALLRRLAEAPGPVSASETRAANALRAEDFIVDGPAGVQVAVPVFATWIRAWSPADDG